MRSDLLNKNSSDYMGQEESKIFSWDYISCGNVNVQDLATPATGVLATGDKFSMLFPHTDGHVQAANAVSIGAFAAGMFGLEHEASKGTFITRKNLRKAQAALLKADPKMRALVEHLEYYQRSDAQSRAERLSAQYITRHMTNDKWFAFLSTADRGIDAVTIFATALNFGIDENGIAKRLDRLPEGSKNIIELMELEQNP